jgi:hypothetical protein
VKDGFHSGVGDGEPPSLHKNFHDHLWKTISEIIALLSWPEGWNGYDAASSDSESVRHALMWIEDLYRNTLTTDTEWMAPHVVLDAEGNVVLEWWEGQKKLTVYVHSETVEYFKVWGPDIFTEMEDSEAEEIEDRRMLWNWLTV